MIFPLLQLLPDWAPNIHPVLVHFPIAIFFFAALMDFLSFFLPERWWGEHKTAITYLVGGVFAIIVFVTGGMAADSINIAKTAYEAVGMHAGWAKWTVWYFGIYAALRFIFVFIDKLKGLTFHGVMFALSLVGLFFLYETGEHGGKLVFHYGLGIKQVVSQGVSNGKMPQKPGFHEKNGAISWMIDENTFKVLNDHFAFLDGDSASMHAKVVQKNHISRLQMLSPDFFLVTNKKSFSNIQAELEVNPGDYEGDIILAHNVHDARNYAYMVLHHNGTAQLGQYKNGENSTIKKGSFTWNGLKHIKLAISGEHVHGYVNNEQILHGHAEQAGPGAVGLKLNGKGSLAIGNMKIITLFGDEHEEQDHAH